MLVIARCRVQYEIYFMSFPYFAAYFTSEIIEAVAQKCSVRKDVLINFAKFTGNTCPRIFFFIKLQAKACNVLKKETLEHVFSCEFCEISKNTLSYRTLLMAASEITVKYEKRVKSFSILYGATVR